MNAARRTAMNGKPTSALSALTLRETLRAQANVLHALMMRDIRTRMFGSAWGFLFVIAWPLSHILVLVTLYSSFGRLPPYGESMALWVATGVAPFMTFSYMSRFTMTGIVMNRPLLHFPVISAADILFARIIVEVLNAALVIFILMIIFAGMGIDFIPHSASEAFLALGAAMLLGCGAGVVSSVIAAFMPGWMIGYSFVIIFLWITSGILFVPSQLPAEIKYYLSFLPTVHITEWMRTAYYDDFNSDLLSKEYILNWSIALIAGGLAAERVFRGKTLSS